MKKRQRKKNFKKIGKAYAKLMDAITKGMEKFEIHLSLFQRKEIKPEDIWKE